MGALGERESGTERLEQAIGAFRESLKEWTAETAPHYRRAVLTNLAKAEKLLAARQHPHPQT